MSNATYYYSSYFIRLTRLELVVNGIISPFVIVLTVLTNFLVCAVLLRRHMRSKTNSILVAMAVADTLTGTCPLPSHNTDGHKVSTTGNDQYLSAAILPALLHLDTTTASQLGPRSSPLTLSLVFLLLLLGRYPSDGVPYGVYLADGLSSRPALHLRFSVPTNRGHGHRSSDGRHLSHSGRLRCCRTVTDLPLL